jgi:hypothetical protein
MGRRRKQSTAEEMLDLIFDMTGTYWQIGAVFSIMLMVVSFVTYNWVNEQYLKALSSPYLSQLAHSYGWAFYSIPLLLVGIAVLLGLKSYVSYRKEHF